MALRVLLALFVLPLAQAQFPAVCNTPDSLKTKTCCPGNCGFHGTCVSIREEVESSWNNAEQGAVEILRDGPPNADWPLDVHYHWPLRVFERVCSCHVGWGGYDCSRCDFGFIANATGECVKRNTSQLLVRRNFKMLSKQEQSNYVRLLELAKNEEEKEWAVLDSEPADDSGSFTMQNVSTYDMFVFVHVLTSRERHSKDCMDIIFPDTGTEEIVIDFAHRGPHFPTWHRYYLLLMEQELHRIGEKVGITDFALPYFDWTPSAACLLFTHELLGTPMYSDMAVNVSGVLFESGKWPVVCDQHYRSTDTTPCANVRTLCNIERDRKQARNLQRGSSETKEWEPYLPNSDSIEMTLAANDYSSNFGHESRLEGDVELCAGEDVKCMFRSTAPMRFNNMHNTVHVYLGGHHFNLQSSVNDPTFFLHHANVDRVFESLLQKFTSGPPAYMPTNGEPMQPGWNLNDFLVPLYPLKTNADMYKVSKDLGYKYDGWSWSIPTSDFQIGCANHTEHETCNEGGYHPQCSTSKT